MTFFVPRLSCLNQSWIWAFGVAVTILATGGCGPEPSSGRDSDTATRSAVTAQQNSLESARALLARGKRDEALKQVKRMLISEPENREAIELASEIYQQQGEYCEAARLTEQLAELDPSNAVSSLILAFDRRMRCGDFQKAEENLRHAASIAEGDPRPHRLLAQWLNAQGRRYEASGHVRELIRLRAVEGNEVLSLIDLRGPFQLASFDPFIDRSKPNLFQLGDLRFQYIAQKANPADILDQVQQLRETFPKNPAVAAFEGRVIAELGRFSLLKEWHEGLPDNVERHPEYWFSIGMWMADQDRHEEAIRAFGEAIRRDPTDRESLRSMLSSLNALGKREQAQVVSDRLAELDRIFRFAKNADAEQARWISGKLQEHARMWESTAWLARAASMEGNFRQIVPDLERRRNAILQWEKNARVPGDRDEEQGLSRIAATRVQQILGFNLSDWPLPDLQHLALSAEEPAERVAGPARNTGLQFTNVAGPKTIATSFVSEFPLDGSPYHLYQVNGGGLAAFDYDLDGHCDLYVMQSGGDPRVANSSEANQFFRGTGSETFQEVTEASSTGDRGYGQGVCAGDVNQDGFIDLLLANIGRNVILINQGDGTFRRADELLPQNLDYWTSSLGLADMTGDHLPEIMEVNYVDDPRAFVTRCDGRDYLKCQPQEFRKCPDRLLQGQPDGRFEESTLLDGSNQQPKLGFALVIANIDRQHGNDCFVANDGDWNFFWASTPEASDSVQTTPGTDPHYALKESATVRGCSIGRGGNSQACMGIASGDFNRDGTLDFHVTNFRNEPVNLFLQSQSGIFSDAVSKYGLLEESLAVLGFGTQAADFDNDGWLDIAVMNGHVFDARIDNIPFRMPPQLFRGSEGQFHVQNPESAGTYWQDERLGRTLAKWDFNRDGRMDLVANHLDAPLALLRNDAAHGNWLQLELVGVESERDAIGTEVSVQKGSETWFGWNTGGDGLMCTNEAVLHFGFGGDGSDDADETSVAVDRITVRWPSGRQQVFENVPAAKRYLLVEGQESLHRREEP